MMGSLFTGCDHQAKPQGRYIMASQPTPRLEVWGKTGELFLQVNPPVLVLCISKRPKTVQAGPKHQ